MRRRECGSADVPRSVPVNGADQEYSDKRRAVLVDGSFPAITAHQKQRSQVVTDSERSWEQRQVESLMHEIADRLRPICARMPAEEFDQLVEGIARMQRKWQRTEAQNFLNESRCPPKELE